MAKKSSDTARDFFRTLKRAEKTAPFYLLFGEETFLLDLALKEVVAAALPRGINDFNFDRFYGREVVGEKVVGTCETLVMFGGKRVVIVKEIQSVPSNQLHAVAEYLKDPCPTTTLICHGVTRNKKLQKTTKFYKQGVKSGVVQEFKPLREWEIGTFLKRQASARGLVLSKEAEGVLVKAVGTDLATLDASLEKIDLYIGAGEAPRNVGPKVLMEVVAATRTREIWDLTDAVARRDLSTSLSLLGAMIEQGQSGVGINMMVSRHFRQLFQVKAASKGKLSKQEIARSVGMSPFFVDRYRTSAAKFSNDELRRIRSVLLKTDKSLKSSRLKDRLILEEMILAVCA